MTTDLQAVRQRASRSSTRSARGERFLLVTHENPDGDALGSLVAMQGVLRLLGKDSAMFVAARRVPAALRVPLVRPRRPGHRRSPTTSPTASSSSWTAATSTAPRCSSATRPT